MWNETDDPADVDAALDRGEPHSGVMVIALALNHADPRAVLPRVARAMRSPDPEIRRQGVIALAHTARLHHTVDRDSLELLRAQPRGNEADDDLWSFVPHRRLPGWLWAYHWSQPETWLWLVRDSWRRPLCRLRQPTSMPKSPSKGSSPPG